MNINNEMQFAHAVAEAVVHVLRPMLPHARGTRSWGDGMVWDHGFLVPAGSPPRKRTERGPSADVIAARLAEARRRAESLAIAARAVNQSAR